MRSPRPRAMAARAAVAGGVLLLLQGVPAASRAVEPPAKSFLCTACHGPQGNPNLPEVPMLAGQSARYLYLQLRDFQEGRRTDPVMSAMSKDLSRDEMHELAGWFAEQRPLAQPFQPDADRARRGQAKAAETLCTMCHLGGFVGQNEIPRVAGQPFAYVLKQLRDFKARRRTNDAGNMTSVASTLSDDDIENLAHYVAGL